MTPSITKIPRPFVGESVDISVKDTIRGTVPDVRLPLKFMKEKNYEEIDFTASSVSAGIYSSTGLTDFPSSITLPLNTQTGSR